MRVAIAALVVVAGCRTREVVVDAGVIDPVVTIAPDDPGELLYVDLGGRVRRARGVAAVPPVSRAAVATEGPDGAGGRVWIADVSAPPPSPEGWPARRASAAELERRGLAALPPAHGSRVALPAAPAEEAPPADGVVVYGTAWCAATAEARAWLDARGVPYTVRDVERDAAAATDAAARCAQVEAGCDRVPVIDVAGRVIVGFDPGRLSTIMGEPI